MFGFGKSASQRELEAAKGEFKAFLHTARDASGIENVTLGFLLLSHDLRRGGSAEAYMTLVLGDERERNRLLATTVPAGKDYFGRLPALNLQRAIEAYDKVLRNESPDAAGVAATMKNALKAFASNGDYIAMQGATGLETMDEIFSKRG